MGESHVARLDPVQHQSAPLRNKIIAALRSAIETGHLRPGARLVERDLCEQLNVSRTSLREALRELQADGVLAHTANRGLIVRVLLRAEAANIYRIRAVLEALVVEQFIENAEAEAYAKLASEGEALKKAYRSGSVERIVSGKRSFYNCICVHAGNTLAFDMINTLVLRTSSLRSRSVARKERQVQSIKEIDAILKAIVERNIETAKRLAILHVENSARSAFETEGHDEAAPAKPALAARRKSHQAAE